MIDAVEVFRNLDIQFFQLVLVLTVQPVKFTSVVKQPPNFPVNFFPKYPNWWPNFSPTTRVNQIRNQIFQNSTAPKCSKPSNPPIWQPNSPIFQFKGAKMSDSSKLFTVPTLQILQIDRFDDQ